jgi:hypothetical protein
MSILSPGFNKSLEKDDIRGIKVRGSYSTYDEAKERAEYLQKIDKLHNVFIGEVGKWLPFIDDTEKAKDVNYAEGKLQKLMKSYMENQSKAKELYETRKTDMMMEAIAENEKKKKNKKSNTESNLNENRLDIDISDLPKNSIKQDNLSEESDDDIEKSETIKKLEEELKQARLLLDKDTIYNLEEIDENKKNIDNLREIVEGINEIVEDKMKYNTM